MIKFSKVIFPESKLKVGSSTPVLTTGYGTWYYLCDRNPTSSEPDCYLDMPDFVYFWFNQTDGSYWRCNSNVTNDMKWQNDKNGIKRDGIVAISPAFNTAYQPSTTNDCLVTAIVSTASSLTGASDVIAQVDAGLGGGYLSWGECSASGVAVTIKHSLTFPVPVKGFFKLVTTNGLGATSSIIQIKTLIL